MRFARLREGSLRKGSRALPPIFMPKFCIGESTTLVSGLRDATLQHSEVVTMFGIVRRPNPATHPATHPAACGVKRASSSGLRTRDTHHHSERSPFLAPARDARRRVRPFRDAAARRPRRRPPAKI